MADFWRYARRQLEARPEIATDGTGAFAMSVKWRRFKSAWAWGVWAVAFWGAIPLQAQDQTDEACIPALSYLPLDARQVGRDSHGNAALGTYERISPDGRFILRSYSGTSRQSHADGTAFGCGVIHSALPDTFFE